MKAIALVSGGMDSPVACYLIAKQGIEVIPIYFDNYPFTLSETKKYVFEVISRLRKLSSNIKEPIIINHGKNLEAFAKNCMQNKICLLSRRMMLRIASRIGEKMNANFLVTGDSLAQVASQTLQNISTMEEASELPILRPLIGLDKLEIEEIAKNIGTYDLAGKGGKCAFDIKYPSTHVKLETALEEEGKVNLKKLVDDTINEVGL